MPSSSTPFSRRSVLRLLAGASAAAVASSCTVRSGTVGAATTSAPARLRAVWWGNDERTRLTQDALALFTERTGVPVAAEPADWGGYWDRLATQVAAGDAPDVVQMDEKYLLEYADRQALLDLGAQGLEVGGLDRRAVELGEVDGVLYAVPAGTMAPVLLANPRLFTDAGMELPDDTSWTWEELAEIAVELTDALPQGSYGLTDYSGRDAAFRVWIAQSGAEPFTDGALGFDADVAQGWFARCLANQQSGAAPGASESVEDVAAPLAQRLFSVGRTAMAIYSSNQVTAFDAATGDDLVMLRLPSQAGSAAEAHLSYQASMYWTVTAGSNHPDEAVDLVGLLVNDAEAGALLRTERGLPVNAEVQAAIEEGMTASDRKVVDYLTAIEPELAPTPALTPRGASAFEDILIRHAQEVLFERSTPAEAGSAFVEEVSAALGQG